MAKRYNTVTQKWENITLDWIKETEEIKKETKKMKKYNSKGELFKLERGTIQEIKDYQGRTQIYLTQDEDSKKWKMTFAQGFIEYDGRQTWNKRIPLGICSKKELADWLGYCFDEDDDIPTLLEQVHNDLQDRIKELELEAIKEIEEDE